MLGPAFRGHALSLLPLRRVPRVIFIGSGANNKVKHDHAGSGAVSKRGMSFREANIRSKRSTKPETVRKRSRCCTRGSKVEASAAEALRRENMELDELKEKWAERDRKLDASLCLNRRLLRDSYPRRAKFALLEVSGNVGCRIDLYASALAALNVQIGLALADFHRSDERVPGSGCALRNQLDLMERRLRAAGVGDRDLGGQAVWISDEPAISEGPCRIQPKRGIRLSEYAG